MTQCERVIQYLQEFGSITTLEAVNELGILRLASRICDLTQEGYKFRRETVTGKNRYGDKTHFTRYYLEN